MLGYILPNKDALKEEEWNLYRGYYCGICKSIARRLGQMPRLALSYDSVFLALAIASLSDRKERAVEEHCIVHPVEKRNVIVENPAVDYAADMMVILAYHKAMDDIKDENSLKARGALALFKPSYLKLNHIYPEICKNVEASLNELSELEKGLSGKLDLTAMAFGKVLQTIFTGCDFAKEQERVLGELGVNLGKWLYLIDALDDLEEDIKKGRYNPLIYRETGTDGIDALIYEYLGRINNAIDVMDIRKNRGIIENIVLMGMRGKTDSIIEKGIKDDGSI